MQQPWKQRGDCGSGAAESTISDTNNNVEIIPFCVTLPSSTSFLDGHDALAPVSLTSHVDPGFGIVGTITLRGQSAIVWFGWGTIETTTTTCDDKSTTNNTTTAVDNNNNDEKTNRITYVGTGKPPMGSLSLSMPPVIRSNGQQRPMLIKNNVPTTQLLGGSSEDDILLEHQISARLAKRVGWPVFVSCSFSGWGGDTATAGGGGGGGGEGASSDVMASPVMSAGYDDSMQQHAVALAEREVSRILLEEKNNA